MIDKEFSLRATGLTEIENIIVLAYLAQETLPRYEADNAPITEQQLKAIKRLEPQGQLVVSENLFA